MKNKSYIYEIEVPHLELGESVKRYAKKKDAIEAVASLATRVYSHIHNQPSVVFQVFEDDEPIKIAFWSPKIPRTIMWTKIHRIPVNEKYLKEIPIQWE